jgi:hypothetical protein
LCKKIKPLFIITIKHLYILNNKDKRKFMEYIKQNPLMPILTDHFPFIEQKNKTEEQTIRDLAQGKLIEANGHTAIVSKSLDAVREENGQERKETPPEKVAAQFFAYREKKEEPEIDQKMENELGELLQSNLVEMPSNSPFLDSDLIILKNDYKGTMPINGIKEKDFKEISALFKAICTKKSSLKIISNPLFSNKIKESIKKLLTRGIGRKLIRKICNFNINIVIRKGERSEYKPEYGYHNNYINISKRTFDNCEILNVMDPDPKGSKRIKLQGEQPLKAGFDPLFVVLAHEIIHAIHFQEDPQIFEERVAAKDQQYDNEEEKLTIEGFWLNSHGKLIYDELNERVLTSAFADKKQQIGYPRFDHSVAREKLEIEGKIIYPDGRERGGAKGSFFPDDSVLEEEFEGKEIQKGRMNYPDGSVEKGAFKKGKLLIGKICIPYEMIMEGTFEGEELNGQGKITFLNGPISEGEFKNGQMYKGKTTFPNGTIEEGAFKNWQLHKGKTTFSDGVIHEGEFKNGQIYKGKATFPNGTIEEGAFKNWQLHKGKTTFSDGVIYEGEFKNGQIYKGKTTFPNGIINEGEFENGDLNGQGKATFPNGIINEGEFKNGRLNGQGKITYTDGTTTEGEFKGWTILKGKTAFPDGSVNELG